MCAWKPSLRRESWPFTKLSMTAPGEDAAAAPVDPTPPPEPGYLEGSAIEAAAQSAEEEQLREQQSQQSQQSQLMSMEDDDE